MKSRPSQHFAIGTLGIVFLLLSVPRADGEMKGVEIGGLKYVSTKDISKFHEFEKMEKRGARLLFTSRRMEMELHTDSSELFIKNVKFSLSDPIRAKDGEYYVSETDWRKLIDPVIRPSRIRQAQPFRVVVIDPGHGGVDSGTKSIHGEEKRFALATALMLKEELEKMGYRVAMTRSRDVYPTLDERVKFANETENAVFVSIHFNWSSARGVSGLETFTLSPPGTVSHQSGNRSSDPDARAGNVRDSENIALATAVHSHLLVATTAKDRGIKRAHFKVLSGINKPAILVEGGFMSNAGEARLIADPTYQRKMAVGIAKGIDKYRVATTSR